jgi:hypothetical protein
VAVWAQLFTSSKAVFKPVGAAFAQALLQAATSLQTYPGMFHRDFGGEFVDLLGERRARHQT